MEDVLTNDRLSEIFRREQSRLRNFVRRRVADEGDAEDILQDVFRVFAVGHASPYEVAQPGLLPVDRFGDALILFGHCPLPFQRRIHLCLFHLLV